MTSWPDNFDKLSEEAQSRVKRKLRLLISDELERAADEASVKAIAELDGFSKGLEKGDRTGFIAGMFAGVFAGIAIAIVYATVLLYVKGQL
jgi:hypothetical protein